jgi:hypothetical protein
MSSHYYDEACLVFVQSGCTPQGSCKTMPQARNCLYLLPAEQHADVSGIRGADCVVIEIQQNSIRLRYEDPPIAKSYGRTRARLRPPRGEYSHEYEDRRGFAHYTFRLGIFLP